MGVNGQECIWVLITIVVFCQLVIIFPEYGVEGKSIGRSWSRGNVGGGRTYLKKFGKRSVVYHRKIFNTKYKNDDVEDLGIVNNNEKFKRRLSDGASFLQSRSSQSTPDSVVDQVNSTTTVQPPSPCQKFSLIP